MENYRPDRSSLLIKISLAAALAALVAFIVVAVIHFSGESGVDDAIEQYEDGDYVEALQMLNALARRATYDRGELIYYYRCKSINRVAERLERRFDDELKIIAAPGTPKDRRESEKRDLEETLRDMNADIQGDLGISISGGTGRIVPGGRFYDEFVSRYKGSRYIEDLDFEEVEKVERTDRGRLLVALSGFYSKYPGTSYLSQIIRILFNNLEKSSADFSGRTDMLTGLIAEYGRRYPTSSEMHRIFTCKGDGVNLRNTPGVQGKIVGKVKQDEILIQIEKSMDTVQIGESRDYWYRVMTLAGMQGWIFGKFLAPIDIAKYGGPAAREEAWSFEEIFSEWSDSNTPKNWIHVVGADTRSILFYEKAGQRIAKLSSAAESGAGLYRRVPGAGAFTIVARGRYISGESLALVAYSMGVRGAWSVRLGREEIDVSGRRIPLGTAEWHDYRITSEDGKYASVYIDGELMSSRIPPRREAEYTAPGIYCLVSNKGQDSAAELEHVKYR
jgi:hypothetical protein